MGTFMKRWGFNVNEETYSYLAKASAESGNIQRASTYVYQVKEDGFQPSTDIYDSYVYFWASKGKMDRVKQVIQQKIKKSNLPVQLSTYEQMLRGFIQGGHQISFERVLSDISADGLQIELNFAERVCNLLTSRHENRSHSIT